MRISRRSFMKGIGVGISSLGLSSRQQALSFPSPKRNSDKLLVKDPDHPKAAPLNYDRLPLSWYKNTVKRFKDKVAAKGVEAIVLEDSWNMTYFTGNFMTRTERPCWVVFPVKEDGIFWYTPGLDNELVKSWWCTEMDYYYDFPHAKGGYPDKGRVIKWNTVDLFEWLLKGLKRRGFAEKVIGFDSELPDWQENPQRARSIF